MQTRAEFSGIFDVLKQTSLATELFGDELVLLESVDELFELEFALMESRSLTREELIRRSAFFKSVGGEPSDHYRLCRSMTAQSSGDRSNATQEYFQNGQYSTGYATHGLFPYRGKFHPQLVKGLLNILRVQPGETVLDPMCGSGTLNVEASLLGIHSVAADISPFCRFMTQVKCQSLALKPEVLDAVPRDADKWFDYFSGETLGGKLDRITDATKRKMYELALLAFLDAMGYARRVSRLDHRALYRKVLGRYYDTVAQTTSNLVVKAAELGRTRILECEARSLTLEDASVDCVVTSPPYSFAIDYAENDAAQLNYLGYDVDVLRNQMLGLAGRTKSERLNRYFQDMELVVKEIVRVLRPGKFAVLVVGSNTNQTGGVRLEQTIIDHFVAAGTTLIRSILKPIRGMRNTMKEEFVLVFRKGTQ